jgi:hypothetical protein
MTDKPGSKSTVNGPDRREDRLKAALKANLAKRKAQSRARLPERAEKTNGPGISGQKKDD